MEKGENQSREDSWAVGANEARRLLGNIGRNTIYELCQRGQIPHKRIGGKRDELTGEMIGGRILFSKKRLREWLEKEDSEHNGGE